MRLQTRFFLGTSALVLAVMAAQWWLHMRQLGALPAAVGAVATSVGRDLLGPEPRVIMLPRGDIDVHREMVPEGTRTDVDHTVVISGDERLLKPAAPAPAGRPVASSTPVPAQPPAEPAPPAKPAFAWVLSGNDDSGAAPPTLSAASDGHTRTRVVQQFSFHIAQDRGGEQGVLVVTADPGFVRRVPIPLAPTVRLARANLREGMLLSLGVLAVGLVASGVMARRVTAPLGRLAAEAEVLGRGALGVQVPEDAGGEVGELQRAFNRMSQRLAQLEQERAAWREREHLVQLGDLARGLAHTVRNPLNTLGLAVEELSGEASGHKELVVTARAQIRRIDRWLRSFLAVGAGDAGTVEITDLAEVAQSVVLEAIQGGADVGLAAEPVGVEVVPTALRAALANLVENAVQASPPDELVEVKVRRFGSSAEVAVRDRGPGLPADVRERLFAPHVSTRPAGSGMGLFLARALVVGMHGGELEIGDAEGGGTLAIIRLPVAAAQGAPS
jgi:signal transduction histidine kinase